MFRSRGENLRSVYILLFLTIAFFLLEHQDPQKYARLFAFDWPSVLHGEVWRIFTYQFTQAGQGWFAFPRAVVLFFSLLLLYLMGAAIEEEWGTRHFLTIFLISTLGSAAAGAVLGIPLLGSYFVNFTLLFIYASVFPEQTFFLFALIPVRIRWIAYIAAVVLIAGVFLGGAANIAALAGAAGAYLYFLAQRVRIVVRPLKAAAPNRPDPESEATSRAVLNAARFVAIKRVLASGSSSDIDRVVAQCERDMVPGVNICPPADYKPEHTDGYCIRCEGFSECAARYLAMNRPVPPPRTDASPIPERTR